MESMQPYIKVKLNGWKSEDTKKKKEIKRMQIRRKIMGNLQSRKIKKDKRKIRNISRSRLIRNKIIWKELKEVRKK